ncbi:hypothetical protein BDP81DRAFT_55296 [Colletotrichum phormii]|uniref:GPI inositol-deacylase n=1 Tax=Colletotrichum phormii TaxID=359342 RepID=A0AAI9ZMY8_9PEZI|nr:uncharacterized protein BDP81DRAFT_55296 [Colletotrichum phormii]KAK1634966.1 hypothetical protein BDP81DRAFT_55296 [Colletotrichum phormii]
MDKLTPLRKESNGSSTFSSRLARTLTFRSQRSNQYNKETAEEVRGPYGLVLLSSPSEPIVDFVFVHGLRGGSRKTWSKSEDPLHFWPKEWLPRDTDFKHVRIHSFGYNSDWSQPHDTVLNVHDFGKSLLGALDDSPLIRRDATLPLVMVGHSMGGLVIKKAYILAKRDPIYHGLSDRFNTLFFVATPHRGADSAQLLSNLLRAASLGNHSYLTDLRKNSPSIESINDEFRHIHDRLSLYSFYETEPTNLGIRSSLIVEKDSAILGYAGERAAYINADHRGVCKFNTPEDSNYLILRHAFAHAIEGISEGWSRSRTDMQREHKQRLESFLDIHQPPEDQYLHHSYLKIQNTCDWLVERPTFQEWRDSGAQNVYWLSGNPASGKSVMSAHIKDHLEGANFSCSYFFFTHDSKVGSDLSYCLRSIAYQMASSNIYVRDTLLAMIEDGSQLAKSNFRAIWQKLFVGGIFRTPLFQPYFWVLDGLDECEERHELVKMLGEIPQEYPLRVFVTARPSAVLSQPPGAGSLRMHHEQLLKEESAKDIHTMIEANRHLFPEKDDSARRELIQQIIGKADGCFLWVKLVVDELRKAYSPKDIQRILDSVPVGMDALYSRILKSMEQVQYGREVAKAIIRWTVLSSRPLTVGELDEALQLDQQDTIPDLASKVASACGHLVYVDSKDRVRMIHQTARDFLLQPKLHSEFALKSSDCHGRLAKVCLGYLLGNEMKGPRGRRSSAARILSEPSTFATYACSSFFEHVRGTSSGDRDVFMLLHDFVTSSNVLRWIELVAKSGNLEPLVRTAKVVDGFLRRRLSKHPSFEDDKHPIIATWSIDLLRLASKFGRQLLMAPWSIHNLVPPFCPPDSAVYKQFGTSRHSITVQGLSNQSWDDRISCFVAPGEQTSAAAYGDGHYAVGYSSGLIVVFQTTSCQVLRTMHHFEHIKSLEFSHSGRMLASGAMKSIQVFNIHTGDQILKQDTGNQCLALCFDRLDQHVSAVLRNNEKMTWKIDSGALLSSTSLVDQASGSTNEHSMVARAPLGAAFSLELNLLAIVFRAPSVMIWDLENECFFGYCNRRPDSQPAKKVRQAPALSAIFCSRPGIKLMAATYFDGELILFDPEEDVVIASAMAGGEVLACSPDGKTLATGDSAGNIQLFEFDTLKLLYRINSFDDGIKSLALSVDGRRFIDIRGSTCNVWEPSELIRQEPADQNSDSDGRSTTAKEINLADDGDLVMITSCAVQSVGEIVICGKDDGSVCHYDAQTGQQLRVLYNHGQGAAITHLSFDSHSGLIASADDSSTVMVHKMSNRRFTDVGEPLARIKYDDSISQLFVESKRLFIVSPSAISIFSTENGKRVKSLIRGQHIAADEDPEIMVLLSGVHDPVKPWKWLMKAGQVILLDSNGPVSFRSDSLESTTELTGVPHSGTKSRSSHIWEVDGIPETAILCFDDQYLAMTSPSANPLDPPIFSLRPSPLAKTSTSVSPNAAVKRIARYLAKVLGSVGSKLIFIDRFNWVSSIELAADHYARHFCVPSDWLSMNGFLVEVTETMVVFVRRNEIAVVRNWFTVVDDITIA